MIALCDVNEYRHCMKEFKVPLLDRLFSVLLALVNLLVVQADNLKEVGSDEQLVGNNSFCFILFLLTIFIEVTPPLLVSRTLIHAVICEYRPGRRYVGIN